MQPIPKMAMECSICYDRLLRSSTTTILDDDFEEVEVEEDVVLAECGHIYHLLCLNKWLRLNPRDRSCPTCRSKIQKRNNILLDLSSQTQERESDSKPVNALERLNALFQSPKPSQSGSSGSGHKRTPKVPAKCYKPQTHEELEKDYKKLKKLFQVRQDQLETLKGQTASLRFQNGELTKKCSENATTIQKLMARKDPE